MDRRTQLTEVVEVAGCLVGKAPNGGAEGRSTPPPLGQLAPADSGKELGILLRHRSQGVRGGHCVRRLSSLQSHACPGLGGWQSARLRRGGWQPTSSGLGGWRHVCRGLGGWQQGRGRLLLPFLPAGRAWGGIEAVRQAQPLAQGDRLNPSGPLPSRPVFPALLLIRLCRGARGCPASGSSTGGLRHLSVIHRGL